MSPAQPTAHHPQHASPMDASKLNHTPAPLPPLASSAIEDKEPSPPLRSPDGMGLPTESSSGYLGDNSAADMAPAPSHPTVAETGALASSPGHGPGPSHGQLQRRESQAGRRIIRLASFGGEGLTHRPPPPLPPAGEEGVDHSSAVV